MGKTSPPDPRAAAVSSSLYAASFDVRDVVVSALHVVAASPGQHFAVRTLDFEATKVAKPEVLAVLLPYFGYFGVAAHLSTCSFAYWLVGACLALAGLLGSLRISGAAAAAATACGRRCVWGGHSPSVLSAAWCLALLAAAGWCGGLLGCVRGGALPSVLCASWCLARSSGRYVRGVASPHQLIITHYYDYYYYYYCYYYYYFFFRKVQNARNHGVRNRRSFKAQKPKKQEAKKPRSQQKPSSQQKEGNSQASDEMMENDEARATRKKSLENPKK